MFDFPIVPILLCIVVQFSLFAVKITVFGKLLGDVNMLANISKEFFVFLANVMFGFSVITASIINIRFILMDP